MKRFTNILLAIITTLSTITLNAQSQIALWNYNAIVGAPTAPVADLGTGTSSVVGSLVVGAAATGMDPIINNGCKKEMFLRDKVYSLKAISAIRSFATLKMTKLKKSMKNSVPKVMM